MKILKGKIKKSEETVVTIGNFDGVHLGHAKILKRVSARARKLGIKSTVYTFDPHPQKILSSDGGPPLITTTAEKNRIIEAHGIDYLAIAKFTKTFAAKHPRDFISEEIAGRLRAREVIVGHDYSFGKGKSGTIEYLEKLGKEFGFGLTIIPAYRLDNSVVSSSRVRKEILMGEAVKAKKLLGRPFSISGTVVRGRDIGKELGFPTANLKLDSELLPADGIYATVVTVGKKRYMGALNIGTSPTFGDLPRSAEVFLLDFKGDLYKKELSLDIIRRIRGEKRFSSIEALAKRIAKDVERVRIITSKLI